MIPRGKAMADAEPARMPYPRLMSSASSHSHLWPGVPLAAGAALLFGSAPPLAKVLSGDLAPFMLAAFLYLGAGIGLAALRAAGRRGPGTAEEAPLRRSDLPWLAAVIATGGVAAPVLLMMGLSRGTASGASLLLNLEGLATMAIAWIVFDENVDRRLFVGALAILAGAALVAWDGEVPQAGLGSALVAAACIAWSIDNNLTRRISAVDPTTITIAKGMVAGGVDLGLGLLLGEPLPSPAAALGASITGFFCVGVSLVLYIRALRELGTARTGAYFSLAPFIGALLSVVALGERPTAALAAAAGLMAVGLWIHLTERHGHEHEHEDLEHEHLHDHDEHHRHDHEGAVEGPHSHPHRHQPVRHSHVHYPDLHHRHEHGDPGRSD